MLEIAVEVGFAQFVPGRTPHTKVVCRTELAFRTCCTPPPRLTLVVNIKASSVVDDGEPGVGICASIAILKISMYKTWLDAATTGFQPAIGVGRLSQRMVPRVSESPHWVLAPFVSSR